MAENEEGGISTIKKTIIGIVTTAVTAAGVYVTTHIEAIFGGDKEEPKTEQVEQVSQPTQSQPSIILNVDNSSKNSSSNGGGNTVIREGIIEKQAAEPAPKPKKEEEDPW